MGKWTWLWWMLWNAFFEDLGEDEEEEEEYPDCFGRYDAGSERCKKCEYKNECKDKMGVA